MLAQEGRRGPDLVASDPLRYGLEREALPTLRFEDKIRRLFAGYRRPPIRSGRGRLRDARITASARSSPGLRHWFVVASYRFWSSSRDALDVRGDVPDVPEGVRHPAAVVAVFAVLNRHQLRRPGRDGALEHRVYVLHIEENVHRRAAGRSRAAHADVGRLVGEHDRRVADHDLRVTDPPVRVRPAKDLRSPERLLVELDGLRCALDGHVRRHGVEPLRDGVDLATHTSPFLAYAIKRKASLRTGRLVPIPEPHRQEVDFAGLVLATLSSRRWAQKLPRYHPAPTEALRPTSADLTGVPGPRGCRARLRTHATRRPDWRRDRRTPARRAPDARLSPRTGPLCGGPSRRACPRGHLRAVWGESSSHSGGGPPGCRPRSCSRSRRALGPAPGPRPPDRTGTTGS